MPYCCDCKLMKEQIQELSNYWKYRAKNLNKLMPDGSLPSSKATLIAIELGDCAIQLDRLLAGRPTEAQGFNMEMVKMKIKDSEVIFSTGKTRYANGGIIGLSPDKEIIECLKALEGIKKKLLNIILKEEKKK